MKSKVKVFSIKVSGSWSSEENKMYTVELVPPSSAFLTYDNARASMELVLFSEEQAKLFDLGKEFMVEFTEV